jgi:cobalt-zinc-cadmium efflux system membrane fusion protein
MRYTFILLLALSLAACNQPEEAAVAVETTPEPTNGEALQISNQQFESVDMDLVRLSEQPFYESISANGLFEVPPKYQSLVSAYYGGYVKQLDLLPGQYVRRGQVLFTLENPAFIQTQREFLEAQSQLNYLESEYERLKALAEENVTARKNFLKAEADYKLTKVQHAALKKQLELMRIDPEKLTADDIQTTIAVLAPISGYVMEVMVHKGQLLNPEDAALHLINKDHLHLELTVFEKELPKLKKGQPIRFSTPNLPGETYAAEVYLINPAVDPQTRKLMVHGHLEEEKLVELFSPGNYIEGEILTSSRQALALPAKAVVELDGTYYVLLLDSEGTDGYRFTQKEVQVGQSTADYIEILNAADFSAKDRFLGEGAFRMVLE